MYKALSAELENDGYFQLVPRHVLKFSSCLFFSVFVSRNATKSLKFKQGPRCFKIMALFPS